MSFESRNKIIMGGVTAFVIIGLFIILIFPTSQADDIIILQTPSGTTSCVEDFVLAQNLTDLCDVVIVSPTLGEVLKYNGTHWIDGTDLTGGGGVTELDDLTDVVIVFPQNNEFIKYNGTHWVDIKLIEGSGIDIIYNGTHTTFTNASPESTICSNTGVGVGVCNGNNIDLHSLLGSTTVSIVDSGDQLTFASNCINTGTGEAICESANNINSLIAGTGVSVTDTTGDLTIANTGVTSLTSADTDGLALSGGTGAITITPKMELLCQNALGSPATSISCSSFTERRYLVVFAELQTETADAVEMAIQFNGDTSTNYSWRRSSNGNADSTATSDTSCSISGSLSASGTNVLVFMEINNNLDGARKTAFIQSGSDGGAGATSAPGRIEEACKWDNITNQISTISFIRDTGTGNYNTDSRITVWGWD